MEAIRGKKREGRACRCFPKLGQGIQIKCDQIVVQHQKLPPIPTTAKWNLTRNPIYETDQSFELAN